MARFIYRMQNILNIKYKLEEQAKQHYMEARHRLDEEMERLNNLYGRKESYMQQYRQLVSARIRVKEVENCKNSILIMEEYIAGQQRVVAQREEELAEAAKLMNEAMQERKIQEKLRERRFEEFLQELNQEEMKEIDQLVSYQYNGPKEEES